MARNRVRNEDEWQALGRFTIDTGVVLLIDPAYLGMEVGGLGYAELPVPGGDCSAVVASTGMGDGRYLVEGRFCDCPFGRRLAEIRIRFLDDDGNWLGADSEDIGTVPKRPTKMEPNGRSNSGGRPLG